MKKFAFVLSGGGFKGVFQVGALRILKSSWRRLDPDARGMKFDIVAGVSVGSLNGVFIACNEFHALEKLWVDLGHNVENIHTSDFIDTKNQTDELKVNLDFRKIKDKFIPNVALDINLWKGLGMLLSKSKRKKFMDQLLDKVQEDFSANFHHFKAIADNAPLRRRPDTHVSKDMIKDCIYKCGFVSLNDGQYYSYRHTGVRVR